MSNQFTNEYINKVKNAVPFIDGATGGGVKETQDTIQYLADRTMDLEKALLEALKHSNWEASGRSVVPKSTMTLRHYCKKFALIPMVPPA